MPIVKFELPWTKTHLKSTQISDYVTSRLNQEMKQLQIVTDIKEELNILMNYIIGKKKKSSIIGLDAALKEQTKTKQKQ